ncbi:hypothetical protein BH23ACT10_BH23ACT10_13510 [soil metagenome]
MPKRPPGVYKRRSTWSIVIDRGRNSKTGKRNQVWHSGFATLTEASEARTRLLRERDTGAAIDPSRQTFAEFIHDGPSRTDDQVHVSDEKVGNRGRDSRA